MLYNVQGHKSQGRYNSQLSVSMPQIDGYLYKTEMPETTQYVETLLYHSFSVQTDSSGQKIK